MTMYDRIAELTSGLSQLEAEMKATQSQGAKTLIVDGRTITRADMAQMRASRNQIITELNTLKALAVGVEPPLLKGVNLS